MPRIKTATEPFIFNEFNNFSSDNNNTPENISSKYYDINQLESLKENTGKSCLAVFHLESLKKYLCP